VKSLKNGFDFKSSITRACFEDINAEFFKNAIKIVEDTIVQAKLSKSEIHEVILVGGSTYIPKVQQMLQECFKGKTLNRSIKPDEAVAYGASVLASILSGDSDEDFDLLLLDITPHSLGIDVVGDRLSTVIERNTPIPITKTGSYQTAFDNQILFGIGVYEGEDPVASKNHLLGQFNVTGVPPAPAGVEKSKVTFNIDADGILKVIAVNVSNCATNNIVIEEYKNRLSREELEDIKQQEKQIMKMQFQ
jgi:molecular chaperone DnaK (HSP70)